MTFVEIIFVLGCMGFVGFVFPEFFIKLIRPRLEYPLLLKIIAALCTGAIVIYFLYQ